MNPSDLPTITERKDYTSLKSLRKWWAGLSEDSNLQAGDDLDQEIGVSRSKPRLQRVSAESAVPSLSRPSASTKHAQRTDNIPRRSVRLTSQPTAVLQTSTADKFLGTAATAGGRHQDEANLPPFIIHPLSPWYRAWWQLTVVIAAITAILEPYVIAFTPPGLYPYNSGTSVVEFLCIGLIAIDILISFNVARYVNGELVTNRRQLARNYAKLIFWVDLISIIPFDEIALTIAGLNGPASANDPVKAQYLSLLKLVRMLRTYRLSWFFSYLTYNLAAPLLLTTLLRNLFLTFFIANFAACALYYQALQANFAPNTWVGANAEWFEGASTSDMYIYSLYWSFVTLSTTGYGDIHAYNVVEAGMMTIYTLFLFFFTAYIIGSITLLLVKGDERLGSYRDQMRSLTHFAQQHGLPAELQESMQRHLKLHFYNADAADEHVLKAYPSSIRRRVLRELYQPTLSSTYLFAGTKPRFLDALLAVARVELYLPQVDILSQGDYVNELFVIVAGKVLCRGIDTAGGEGLEAADVSVRSGMQGLVSKVLSESDVFGEVAFFTSTAQTDTATTLTTVRVLAIGRATYEQVAEKFPSSQRAVLKTLERHGEDIALEIFPGANGMELFERAMNADIKSAAAEAARGDLAADTGGDPTWRLAPGRAAALRLSEQQEAVVGTLMEIKGLVGRTVAKHDADRTTVWLYAASRDDTGKLREMLSHGFNPDTTDYDSRTALMLAASRGFREVVDVLIAANANPNATDTFGGTALFEACKHGHDDCIDALVDAGGKLGMDPMKQAELLCSAVFAGNLDLLRRLLRAAADPNADDYDGRTALHIAASESNVAAVELLVEGGADMQKRDRWGSTAVDEARRVGAKAVVAFLEAETEVVRGGSRRSRFRPVVGHVRGKSSASEGPAEGK